MWVGVVNLSENHHGYIKKRSALLQLSSLAPPVTPEVPKPLKVHSVHWRRLWGLPNKKPTMVNQDKEGIPYTDHSADEQHQNNQQNQQQVDLDLNATANGGTQNGQPNSGGDNSGGRRSTSAFDRLGPGDPGPRPFGGIGSNDTQIVQDLRHRMQAMEVEVKGLRKENVELKNATKDLRSRRRSPLRIDPALNPKPLPEGVNALRLANAPRLANVPHLGGDVTQAVWMTESPIRMNLGSQNASNTVVRREREDGKGPHPSTGIPCSHVESLRFNSPRAL
ncbi:hypothetical protein PIB30_002479 [Stylosanthes scabra]|uniref:Uncharacterized protein n=1 Tax=Stylosanthes scabra TaxID=79078 RepID=A0ABU6X130_9FABA|nr:hypothetical protein [Stylosanthes scabra]